MTWGRCCRKIDLAPSRLHASAQRSPRAAPWGSRSAPLAARAAQNQVAAWADSMAAASMWPCAWFRRSLAACPIVIADPESCWL
jgi:hypothetical protein